MSLIIEERIEIILLCGQIGATTRSVAESFNSSQEGMNISHTTVGRLLTKFKETGSVHDRERSGRLTLAVGFVNINRLPVLPWCATLWPFLFARN